MSSNWQERTGSDHKKPTVVVKTQQGTHGPILDDLRIAFDCPETADHAQVQSFLAACGKLPRKSKGLGARHTFVTKAANQAVSDSGNSIEIQLIDAKYWTRSVRLCRTPFRLTNGRLVDSRQTSGTNLITDSRTLEPQIIPRGVGPRTDPDAEETIDEASGRPLGVRRTGSCSDWDIITSQADTCGAVSDGEVKGQSSTRGTW
jgi:hypothetical protein